jgi:hypothetical protein
VPSVFSSILSLCFAVLVFQGSSVAQDNKPGEPLQQLARDLNKRLSGQGSGLVQCAMGTKRRFGLWPLKADQTPLPKESTMRILSDVQAFLQKSKPSCVDYLSEATVRTMAADVARSGTLAKNLNDAVASLKQADKAIDVILFARFYLTKGVYSLSLKAVERDTGKVLASTPSTYEIPRHYVERQAGDTARGLDGAIQNAAQELVDKATGMTSLVAGNIYYQNTGAQPEFAVFLMDQVLTAITRTYHNEISNKRLKTEKSRLRSIEIEGDDKLAQKSKEDKGRFRLTGSYWVRDGAIDLQLCLRNVENETACWSGRVHERDAKGLELQPKLAKLPEKQGIGAFTFELMTERGRNPVYRQGELVRLRTRVGVNAWLYCFYTDSENNTVQLLPNKRQAGRRDGYFVRKGVLHEWPIRSRDGFRFRISKQTVGEEILRCIATDRNITNELPPVLRGESFAALPVITVQRLSEIFSHIPDLQMSQASVTISVIKPKSP